MTPPIPAAILADFGGPLTFDFMPAWAVLVVWIFLAGPILWLGVRSLAGLGTSRKWVAIVTRSLLLLCVLLIIAGAHWRRQHKDLEVMVLQDASQSAQRLAAHPGRSLAADVLQYLRAASDSPYKPPGDRIGVVQFADDAWLNLPLSYRLDPMGQATHAPASGTDIGAGIELGIATFDNTAQRRMLLISDGNQNLGDLEPAIRLATSQHVPIDVMPLEYAIEHEVMVDRVVAPTWKREGDPFTVQIFLTSTNPGPVTGQLQLLLNGVPVALDANHPAADRKEVTLRPGRNRVLANVPGLHDAGPYRFEAIFEGKSDGTDRVDTVLENNKATAFTFVRGSGEILYVDNVAGGAGQMLEQALVPQGLKVRRIPMSVFPNDLIELDKYDAVILANVPRGIGGLSQQQDAMIANYVHDMGGGLLMIGGPDALGAGGWQGSKVEEVLPVSLGVPAEREMPKGALVLIMDPCEIPNGTYWGEQCAILATKALSSADEVGIISFTADQSGHHWDFPLQPKGDGSKVTHVLKKIEEDDMPSLDQSVQLALDGDHPGGYGLIASNARAKHIIIISDGDPEGVSQANLKRCLDNHITISTVTAYPHQPGDLPDVMKEAAKATKGQAYGPIENNPSQLPQIFIKEATIVQRSLIQESKDGFPVALSDATSDLVRGIGGFPPVNGLVLTSRKTQAANDIKIALTARTIGPHGKPSEDPLLASWQAGLGRAAVFTSDAANRWTAAWAGGPDFGKLWAQIIRGVARPPMSTDVEVQTTQEGGKGHVVFTAQSKDSGLVNFLNVRGKVFGPDLEPHDLTLRQSGPGVYEATFDARDVGTHVVVLNYANAGGTSGTAVSGLAVNDAPEFRDLSSNDPLLQEIAARTGGRMIPPFEPEQAALFTREGLTPSSSSMPIWDLLIPVAMMLLLMDVTVRRIAWDWAATKRLAASMAQRVREFTTLRQVEGAATMNALLRVRGETVERMASGAKPIAPATSPAPPPLRPNPSAKFVAKTAVEGDISQVVGGATDKPIPAAKATKPALGAPSTPSGTAKSLLEAKRRAQEKILREHGEQQ